MNKYKNNKRYNKDIKFEKKESYWDKIKRFLLDPVELPPVFLLLYLIVFLMLFSESAILSNFYRNKVVEYEKIIKEEYGIIFDNYEEYKSLKNALEIK